MSFTLKVVTDYKEQVDRHTPPPWTGNLKQENQNKHNGLNNNEANQVKTGEPIQPERT